MTKKRRKRISSLIGGRTSRSSNHKTINRMRIHQLILRHSLVNNNSGINSSNKQLTHKARNRLGHKISNRHGVNRINSNPTTRPSNKPIMSNKTGPVKTSRIGKSKISSKLGVINISSKTIQILTNNKIRAARTKHKIAGIIIKNIKEIPTRTIKAITISPTLSSNNNSSSMGTMGKHMISNSMALMSSNSMPILMRINSITINSNMLIRGMGRLTVKNNSMQAIKGQSSSKIQPARTNLRIPR